MNRRRQVSGMLTIGVEPSLERQASEVIPYWEGHWEVERQDVIPYRCGWASGGYSASSLDDRGSVSRSRVTTLYFRTSLGQVSLRPTRPAQVRFQTSLGQVFLWPLLDDVDVRSPLLIRDCFLTAALLDGLCNLVAWWQCTMGNARWLLLNNVDVRSPLLICDYFLTVVLLDGLYNLVAWWQCTMRNAQWLLLDDVDVRSPLLIRDCFSTVALFDDLCNLVAWWDTR